ncbi:hypothetical protein OHT52_02065 [Streptomyces sp. NBC_00247]|uniref:hypothetical protein n=1 Tax=Streptomyces sp. NBC_00247 TaxID=2975689 RepID=UPI002E2C8919|nr:hypothetical protein [Streptomyces sp. NBC_00247]
MSGDSYNFGNVVNMHGGSHNTGMVNHAPAPDPQPVDPALQEAIHELIELLRDLRTHVAPATAQRIDASLPAVSAVPAATPAERRSTLEAVAKIAATVGAIGDPVISTVRSLMELVGI